MGKAAFQEVGGFVGLSEIKTLDKPDTLVVGLQLQGVKEHIVHVLNCVDFAFLRCYELSFPLS